MRRALTILRLLRLLALPRSLLSAHAQAYGQLAGLELAREWALWRRRALLQMLGLGGLLVAAGLGGVALMLWAVLPAERMHAPWMLWVVPLLPAGVAWVCLRAARAVQGPPPFSGLRRQWAQDLAVWRGARASVPPPSRGP